MEGAGAVKWWRENLDCRLTGVNWAIKAGNGQNEWRSKQKSRMGKFSRRKGTLENGKARRQIHKKKKP